MLIPEIYMKSSIVILNEYLPLPIFSLPTTTKKEYYIQYSIAINEQWRCKKIWKYLEWGSIVMGRDKRV